ncbi:calcium-binding protein, partial [Pseudomonas cichorii]
MSAISNTASDGVVDKDLTVSGSDFAAGFAEAKALFLQLSSKGGVSADKALTVMRDMWENSSDMEKAGKVLGAAKFIVGQLPLKFLTLPPFAISSLAANIGVLSEGVSKGNVKASDVTGVASGIVSLIGSFAALAAIGIAGTAVGATAALTAAWAAGIGALLFVGGVMLDVWGDDIAEYLGDKFDSLQREFSELSSYFSSLNDFSSLSVGKLISSLSEKFSLAVLTASPLILDLDGDGVETLGVEQGVHFDHDGNGFAELTGWVGKDDGLLVLDRNGDGVIDRGAELFGNYTAGSGVESPNGFNALAVMDENHDGVVDSLDSLFGELQVWRDSNSDGVVDLGELLTMEQAGVLSLGTGYTLGGVTDSFGNITAQMGSYINIIGETHELNDVWFKVDLARTIDLNEVIFLEGMENYPEISGFGNVTNFSQAVANDASGKLHDLVLRFSSADDYSQRKLILNDIIFFWSGVSGFSTGSRGYYIDDARKVYALEAFLGQQFRQSTGINSGTSDPGPNAAAVLMKAYDQLAIYVDAMLMLQTRFSSYVGKVDFYFKGEEGFAVDVVALVSELYESYQVDPVGVTESIRSFSSSLLAVGGDLGAQVVAELRSAGGEESIGFYFVLSSLGPFLGEGGDDELYGDTGDDTLLGLGGDDIIYGGSGNDLIDGGAGDDYLSGDAGADIYSFSVSWGQDVINNADAVLGRPDKIVFDGTVSSENIILRRSADNLIIRSAISDDMITVVNYFASEGFGVYSLSEIRFADGLVWQWAEVKAITSASTEGDDELHGFDAVDVIKAGAGNDLLYGNGGDDLLFGGRGNDEIYGGEGSDVYSFELGDGFDSVVEEGRSIFDVDVLVFGSGVYASDIKFSLSGVSLVLAHDNGFDKVTIKNWFQSSSGQYQIERVEFADGTFWSSTSLSAQLKEFSGTAGDDTYDGGSFPLDLLVSGGAGNDTLSTGKGSDQLRGGQGSDTLT